MLKSKIIQDNILLFFVFESFGNLLNLMSFYKNSLIGPYGANKFATSATYANIGMRFRNVRCPL